MAASDSIVLIQGKITDSGSDRVYDPDDEQHSDKMVSRRWVMVGSVKLIAIPNKLYDSTGRGDFMIVAYNKKDNKVIAWWNHSQKEGSSTNILNLIFNSYILGGLIGVGLPLWLVFHNEPISPDTMLKIYAGSAVAVALAYVLGFFEWRKRSKAQQMVNEQKSKLN